MRVYSTHVVIANNTVFVIVCRTYQLRHGSVGASMMAATSEVHIHCQALRSIQVWIVCHSYSVWWVVFLTGLVCGVWCTSTTSTAGPILKTLGGGCPYTAWTLQRCWFLCTFPRSHTSLN